MGTYLCWVEDEGDIDSARRYERFDLERAAEKAAEDYFHSDPSDMQEIVVIVVCTETGKAYRRRVEVDFSPSFSTNWQQGERVEELDIKLKPCPFCGGEPRYQPSFWHDQQSCGNNVSCKGCGVKMSRGSHVDDPTPIEKWNMRIDDDVQQ